MPTPLRMTSRECDGVNSSAAAAAKLFASNEGQQDRRSQQESPRNSAEMPGNVMISSGQLPCSRVKCAAIFHPAIPL